MKKKSIERLPRIGDLWEMCNSPRSFDASDLYVITCYCCAHQPDQHDRGCRVKVMFLQDLGGMSYTIDEIMADDVLINSNDEEDA